MISLREKEWLDSAPFRFCDYMFDDEERGLGIFMYLLCSMMGGVVGMLAFGIPLDLFLLSEGYAILSGIGLGLAAFYGVTNMSRLYAANGLPVSEYKYYSDIKWDFKTRAKEYFSLGKADRALYPANIMTLVCDPDLTPQQKHTLNKRMRDIYDAIEEREKAKRVLSKRSVDVEHVLEYMDDSRKSVNVETDTYKEFA